MSNKAIVTLQKMKSYIQTQEELDHINLAIKALEERPTGEWIEEIIEELESRKDYGEEYAQAIEDVIVILNAKFGGRE